MDMAQEDWSTPEYLAGIAADELSSVLEALGINTFGVYLDSEGDVNVPFQDIRDAETMVSLGVPAVHEPGSMYDRASASCITIALFGEEGVEENIRAAIDAGWKWTVHPYMVGCRADWHVSVGIPLDDVHQLVATLNAVRRVKS